MARKEKTVHKYGLEPPSELVQKQLRPIRITTSGKSSVSKECRGACDFGQGLHFQEVCVSPDERNF
ncbi:hypothetical protein ABD75_08865 [Bacillus vallismortis]|nr:hypothetical protein [Bacillus vallismortis]